MGDVGLVVLGAVLALVGSFLAEYYRTLRTDLRAKRLFVTLLKTDIPAICEVAERIIEDSTRLSYVPLERVIEINAMRQGFDGNRNWIVYFREEDFRRDLLNFFKDLLVLTQQVEAVESIQLPLQNPQWMATQRASHLGSFRDIVNKGRDLSRRIAAQ